jgi:hypothetical protein
MSAATKRVLFKKIAVTNTLKLSATTRKEATKIFKFVVALATGWDRDMGNFSHYQMML